MPSPSYHGGHPLDDVLRGWLRRLSLLQVQECLARLMALEKIQFTLQSQLHEGWWLTRDECGCLHVTNNGVSERADGFRCHLSDPRLLDPVFLFRFLDELAPVEEVVLPYLGSGPSLDEVEDTVDYWSNPDYSPPQERAIDYWSNENYRLTRPDFDTRDAARDWKEAAEELGALQAARVKAEAEAEAEAKAKAEAEVKAKAEAEAEAKARADAEAKAEAEAKAKAKAEAEAKAKAEAEAEAKAKAEAEAEAEAAQARAAVEEWGAALEERALRTARVEAEAEAEAKVKADAKAEAKAEAEAKLPPEATPEPASVEPEPKSDADLPSKKPSDGRERPEWEEFLLPLLNVMREGHQLPNKNAAYRAVNHCLTGKGLTMADSAIYAGLKRHCSGWWSD